MGDAPRKLTVGMLKAMPRKWDVFGNWAIFEEQFGRHSNEVDVFITPECFLDGYAVTEKDWTVEQFDGVAQDVRESGYIQRVRELAQRYETPMPQAVNKVAELEGRVNHHLAKMGFSW